ncbi:hypothetical protein [uncultured Endozoicomonas sp.]|uniref:hypothetical protein n=1 Tax=uncultured Endozoicomonas sp. TaxID=432652 RepID=UPI0026261B54|nr:hypothetical protein [uncultured Endozoicomonas sp.]
MGNHSSFGIAYTSPPKKFTTGDPINPKGKCLGDKYFSIATFDVPKDQAYFVNVVHISGSRIERGALSFGDVVKIRGQTLSCLNSEIQFIDENELPKYGRLPIKELKDRNIAVIHSEEGHKTVGDLGVKARQDSFYCEQVAFHPDLSDQTIRELAEQGYFRAPNLNGQYPEKDNRLKAYGATGYSVTSLNMMSGASESVGWLKNEGSEGELSLGLHQSEIVRFHDTSENSKSVQALNSPFISLGKTSPCSGILSKIYSPDAGNFLMLMRHPDTKLPLLSKERAVSELRLAYLENYKKFPENLSASSRLALGIKDAILYNEPYKEASDFCKDAVDQLKKYQTGAEAGESNDVISGEASSNAGSEIVVKSIKTLEFAGEYLDQMREPVSEVIYADTLAAQGGSANKEETALDKMNKERKLKRNILECERDLVRKGIEQDVITEKGDHFPLFNHMLICVALVPLRSIGGLEVSALSKQADGICSKINENQTKTLKVLAGNSFYIG